MGFTKEELAPIAGQMAALWVKKMEKEEDRQIDRFPADARIADESCTWWDELDPDMLAGVKEQVLRHYHQRLIEHGIIGDDWEQCWHESLVLLNSLFRLLGLLRHRALNPAKLDNWKREIFVVYKRATKPPRFP